MLAGAVCTFAAMSGARAGTIDVGNPDVEVRWDNTFKYTLGQRVGHQSGKVMGYTSGRRGEEDGDLSFQQGDLITSRMDLLTELDVSFRKSMGMRVSAAAWYDPIYQGRNNNDGTGNNNNLGYASDKFPKGTADLHGKQAELLDAFVYKTFELPKEQSLSVRLGRYTLLYGESLFFGANGIAGAQTPIDIVKALSLPGAQFKEIGVPVTQTSFQYQISPRLSFGGYYQLEWRPNRVPSAGSYFSANDSVGPGGHYVFLPPGGGLPANSYLHRVKDIEPSNLGQGGLQIRFKPAENWDFGLYYSRFHAKDFVNYVRPGVNGSGATTYGQDLGEYALAYPEGISLYGASFATNIGDTNVSGETSIRTNQPLASPGGAVADTGGRAGIGPNRLYPVGKTFHANLSAITLFNETRIWNAANLVAEVAYNRRLEVTNRKALDPNVTVDAVGLRGTFTPEYYQVTPGLDLTLPITIGYNPWGRSSLGPTVFGGGDSGDITIALQGVWENTWKAGLQFTHYFGPAGSLHDRNSNYSFDQVYADRDYVAFNVQRTF